MFRVPNLTTDPKQKQTLELGDGTLISLSIAFVPNQVGWFITSMSYRDFELNGIRICNSPDMLYQWRNKLPFGLACFSRDDREPSLQEDFASGNSKLYVLSALEVEAYNTFLTGA